MKKTYLLLTCLTGLIFLSSAYAANAKIGVVDFQHVMKSSPNIASAKNKLQKQFEPKQAKLASKQKVITDMNEKMKRDGSIMRKNDKQKLEKQIADAQKELDTMKYDFNKKLFTAQQETMQKLIKEITDVIEKIAVKNNLELVVPKEGVLYAKDQLDITKQVESKLK